MEKTLARAIFKKMEIGRNYSTSDLRSLIGDSYYDYIPVNMHPGQPNGKPVNSVISDAMWNVVECGYATTCKASESVGNVRGLKFGTKPTSFTTYTVRYWERVK